MYIKPCEQFMSNSRPIQKELTSPLFKKHKQTNNNKNNNIIT